MEVLQRLIQQGVTVDHQDEVVSSSVISRSMSDDLLVLFSWGRLSDVGRLTAC